MTYTQRWDQIQSWTPGAVRTKKRKGNFSRRPQEQWIKSPQSAWCTLHLWNTWRENESSQIEEVVFGSNDIYIFPLFLFLWVCMSMLCVWFCLYSFPFTICPRVLSVLFFYYLKNYFFLIIIFYCNNLILFYFILSSSFFLSFFSTFSSEPCGWQGLGAPARCQDWASEVEELSSGHWSTRDLPAHHNIKTRKLSQRSPSQR